MTSMFARFFTASAFAISLTALAQTGAPTAPLPAAPSAAAGPSTPTVAPGSGTKVGTINIEQAVYASNEGQREMQALEKKLEPKQTQLKGMSDELEGLKKQLNAQSDKLSEDARSTLVSQISQKQKIFDRTMQDARDDAQAQNGEIMQKILQKLAPVLMKYMTDNGYGLLIDTTKPWPDGQAIVGPGWGSDITKAVVEAYNTQSGVAPPAPAHPAATHPSGASAKPATPAKPAAK